MIRRLVNYVRERWHPLWRLRKLSIFRRVQRWFDFTVDIKVPEVGLRVAMKVLRDASVIVNSANLECEVRRAFDLILDLLKPVTFWDIGANIGGYSWLVRCHPSVRHVVMFEPDPTNFKLVSRTIRRNAISNCKAMNIAVADRNGDASFMVDRASGATGSLVSHLENTHSLHHAYGMGETIRCQAATVDSLIADGNPAPDFIKIDLEGAEHLVIGGAKSCLARQHPVMIIETSNMGLVHELVDSGYRVFQIDGTNLLFVHVKCGADLTPIERAFPVAVKSD